MHVDQILFVEDDLITSLSTCEFLRDRGMRVIEATCVKSAMSVIDKRGYISGLVSDIDLGSRQDGFDLARSARAAYPGLPVVFVSGGAAARHGAEGVEGSVFINKPYHPRQVIEALRELTIPAAA
jgi:DNA-binding response OmpR family regulator